MTMIIITLIKFIFFILQVRYLKVEKVGKSVTSRQKRPKLKNQPTNQPDKHFFAIFASQWINSLIEKSVSFWICHQNEEGKKVLQTHTKKSSKKGTKKFSPSTPFSSRKAWTHKSIYPTHRQTNRQLLYTNFYSHHQKKRGKKMIFLEKGFSPSGKMSFVVLLAFLAQGSTGESLLFTFNNT